MAITMQMTDSKPLVNEAAEIPMRRRIKLWLLAWAVAFLAVPVVPVVLYRQFFLVAVWFQLIYCWTFPGGLFGMWFAAPPPSERHFGVWAILIGWLLYLALTVFGLRQKRRQAYFITYTVLCVLLATNVVGCQSCTWRGFSMLMHD